MAELSYRGALTRTSTHLAGLSRSGQQEMCPGTVALSRTPDLCPIQIET